MVALREVVNCRVKTVHSSWNWCSKRGYDIAKVIQSVDIQPPTKPQDFKVKINSSSHYSCLLHTIPLTCTCCTFWGLEEGKKQKQKKTCLWTSAHLMNSSDLPDVRKWNKSDAQSVNPASFLAAASETAGGQYSSLQWCYGSQRKHTVIRLIFQRSYPQPQNPERTSVKYT